MLPWLLALAGLVILAHTAPFPFLLDVTSRTIWRMPRGAPPTIYLTFDDGPNPTATPQLLDVLRRHDVRADAIAVARATRAAGGTVVATGGCFDLLHAGHVRTLQAARGLGDCLIVCVNSDASVRRLKGPERPIIAESDRVDLLLALECV